MKRALVVLLVAAMCGFFVASPLAARPPSGSNDPLTLTADSSPGSGGFVEQQSHEGQSDWMQQCNLDPSSCVVNSTPCAWTADSRVTYQGFGFLAAGATASASFCFVADWQQHILGAAVQSASPDLIVKMRYEALGVEFVIPPRPITHGYDYRGCVVGPFYAHSDPQLLPIPGSNGGVGLRTDITMTVTNPTGRKERDVSAQFVLGSNEPGRQAQFCQGGTPGTPFTLAGAIWETGL